jgi:hypothetical protein
MFHAIDNTLLSICEQSVKFIEEWLSISQKWLERIVIAIFVIAGLIQLYLVSIQNNPYNKPWMVAFYIIMFLYAMMQEHRLPEATRKLTRITGFIVRMFWIGVMIATGLSPFFVSIGNDKVAVLYSVADTFAMGARGAMIYITVANIDGHRGKAAQMAWNKIKELFGTSWIPQPIKVGNN